MRRAIRSLRLIVGEWLIDIAVFTVIPEGRERVAWAQAVGVALDDIERNADANGQAE